MHIKAQKTKFSRYSERVEYVRAACISSHRLYYSISHNFDFYVTQSTQPTGSRIITIMPASTRALEPLYEEDIPAAVSLWYSAFDSEEMRRLFPDTPGVRKWWHDTIRNDLLQKQKQKYLKVIEEGKMIAFVKWDLASPEESGNRFLPWHPDMNSEACNNLTTQNLRERERVMGSRKYYCEFVSYLIPFLAFFCNHLPV